MPVTVIVREVSSPLPPVPPWPLIYTFHEEELGDNLYDAETLLMAIAKVRLEELDAPEGMLPLIKEGLELLFAFDGDPTIARDWRD